jgi:hypothetical protein
VVALCPAAIREQERAGLDIITDGEIRRTSAIVPGQVFPINISQKIHTVPFGINYHFVGGGGAPVRAQWA